VVARPRTLESSRSNFSETGGDFHCHQPRGNEKDGPIACHLVAEHGLRGHKYASDASVEQNSSVVAPTQPLISEPRRNVWQQGGHDKAFASSGGGTMRPISPPARHRGSATFCLGRATSIDTNFPLRDIGSSWVTTGIGRQTRTTNEPTEYYNDMFSLGGGGRANEATQGGRIDSSGTGTTPVQRRPPIESDWDNASVAFRDDPSAPNVSARFGDQIRGDSEANDNVFDLNRGGGVNTLTPLGGCKRRRHHQGKSPSSGSLLTNTTRTYRASHSTRRDQREQRTRE
jgi:hypothetical protein